MKLTNHFLLTLALLNSSLIQADDSTTLSAVDEIHDQNVRFGNMFSNKKDSLGFASPAQSSFAREYLLERDPNAESPAGPVCRTTFSAPQPFDFLSRNVSPITFEMSRSSCVTNRRFNLAAGSRFSYSRCSEIYSCTTARIQHLSTEDQIKANSILNEFAARDFAKNFMKTKMESMEKLEVLNSFAHKRFNVDSKACGSRYKAVESKSCNMEVLTKGFKRFQKHCNVPQLGCYKGDTEYDIPDYLTFDNDFKAKNESSAQAYFNLRAEKISSKLVEKDKQYSDELGEIVSSDRFKELSSSEKENMFIELIKKNNDKILSLDFDKDNNSIKQSKEFDNLRKIFLKPKISKKDFAAEFDKLRKERAEAQIAESCSDVPTMANLCATVTSLRKGERSPVNMDNITLSNYVDYEGNLAESEELKKLNAIMGGDFEEGDFELNLDAKRCYAFGYSGTDTDRKPSDDKKKDKDSNEGTGSEEANDTGFGPTRSGSRMEKEEVVASGGEDERVEDSSSTSILPQVFPTEEAYTNNILNPNAYNAVSHLPNKENNDEDEKTQPSEQTTKTEPDTSANDARIADLVKKLSATEDRLEKLKASTEAAEEARVREKKIAEENALIADLRGQINDLKNKTHKPAEVQAPVARQEIVQAAPQSSNYSFSSSRSSDSKNSVSDAGEVSRPSNVDSGSQHSQSASPSSVGRSIASSGSQLSLVNSDNGNDQGGPLILTRVDGMSSEKAAETISNRILELNGVPFLIEEDGVTKKVVPLIRDGKIELDEKGMPKYVKIKVNSKTCSKEDAEKGKCRAPAAVAKNTSPADEKRDEEEKARKELARAQYIKLKALTNEALKSKKSR